MSLAELNVSRPEWGLNPVTVELVKMMDGLDGITFEELQFFQTTVHRFSQSSEVDAISREGFKNPKQYPQEFLNLLSLNGYLNMMVPEEHGGFGAHPLALQTMMEEWSRKDAGLALNGLVQCTLVINPIVIGGSEEQKAAWLGPLMSGDLQGCFCLTESRAGGGSDATNLTTRAEDVGDAWILTGEKMFITAAKGNFMVVAARTGGQGKHGISTFAFEVPSEGLPGLVVSEPLNKNGQPASQLYGVSFDHVRIPKSALLGKLNEGWTGVLEQTLLESRGWVAAQGNGIMDDALDRALAHLESYQMHGKPLVEYEVTQNLLTQMATQINKSRHLANIAAIKIAQGDPRAGMWASMAKYMAGENAPWVTDIVRRFFGGNGLINEYGTIASADNAAKFIATYEGPEEVQALIIMREWMKLGMNREKLGILHPPRAARVNPSSMNPSFESFVAAMKELDIKLRGL